MSRSEAGVVTAEGGYSVTGSYQYRGPDGATYRVDFTADQRGYRPRYGIQLQGSRRFHNHVMVNLEDNTNVRGDGPLKLA